MIGIIQQFCNEVFLNEEFYKTNKTFNTGSMFKIDWLLFLYHFSVGLLSQLNQVLVGRILEIKCYKKWAGQLEKVLGRTDRE